MLYDPWLARSYGFLLSVLATGALLTLAPRWSAALQRRGMPARLAEVLAAAAAAQAVCAPGGRRAVGLAGEPGGDPVQPAGGVRGGARDGARVRGAGRRPGRHAGGRAAGPVRGLAGRVDRLGGPHRGGAARGGGAWPGGWAGARCSSRASRSWPCCSARRLHAPSLAVRRLPRCCWSWWCCGRPPLTRVDDGLAAARLGVRDVRRGAGRRDWCSRRGRATGVVVDAGPDPALGRPLPARPRRHPDPARRSSPTSTPTMWRGCPGCCAGGPWAAIETTGLERAARSRPRSSGDGGRGPGPGDAGVAGERRRAGPLAWRVLWPPRPGGRGRRRVEGGRTTPA